MSYELSRGDGGPNRGQNGKKTESKGGNAQKTRTGCSTQMDWAYNPYERSLMIDRKSQGKRDVKVFQIIRVGTEILT